VRIEVKTIGKLVGTHQEHGGITNAGKISTTIFQEEKSGL